jgi:hypothetical protein
MDTDAAESPPVTDALFGEFTRMLEDALWALSGFPSEPAYTKAQLEEIDALMAAVSNESHRIKQGLAYRRQVMKRQRRVSAAQSGHPQDADNARRAAELTAHLAEVHGLDGVPVAGLTAAHMHSFGAHPEQVRDSCAAFVPRSVAYHVMTLIARNADEASADA